MVRIGSHSRASLWGMLRLRVEMGRRSLFGLGLGLGLSLFLCVVLGLQLVLAGS
jgi:hypothetical protein